MAPARDPRVTDVWNAGDSVHRVGPDPYRGAGSLDRLRADGDVGELVEAALERSRFLRPECSYRLHRLREPSISLRLRDSEASELHLTVALPHAEQEPPAAHDIEKRRCFRYLDRMCKRENESRRTEIRAGALSGHPGQHQERMEAHVRWPKQIVMGGEDPVEATLVRGSGHRLREAKRPYAVPLTWIERADVNAEPRPNPSLPRQPETAGFAIVNECATCRPDSNTRHVGLADGRSGTCSTWRLAPWTWRGQTSGMVYC